MCREELIDFDKYEIREDGSIYSKHWKKQLSGWKDEDGYLVSCLTLKNGKKQPYRINRVIAYLFVPKPRHLENVPYENLQVGHLDIDKKNNNAKNLYWCTSEENNNNPFTKEKQRKSQRGRNNPMWGKHVSEETKKKMSNIHSIPIKQLTKDGVLVEVWKSAKEAGDILGICSGNITACLKKYPMHLTAGGFKWEYA